MPEIGWAKEVRGTVAAMALAGWRGMARGCRIRITFRIRDSAIVD